MGIRLGIGTLLIVVLAMGCAGAAPNVFGSYCFADKQFPQFGQLWGEGFYVDPPNYDNIPLGGYVFIHFQNTGTAPLKVTDITLERVSLTQALAETKDEAAGMKGHSIHLSKLPKEQIDTLKSIGEPLWWKVEPETIPAKGIGQIVIRFRRPTPVESLSVGIVTGPEAITVTVPVSKAQPRFASISFTPDLKTVYLYLRHPVAGTRPERVILDGVNVTRASRLASDANSDLSVFVVNLAEPLKQMTYHCFRVGFADGSAATAGIRAWGNELVYGMWGSRGDARSFMADLERHNVNVQMGHAGREVAEYSLTEEGERIMNSLGIRPMATWFGNARKPIFYFLQDEPDAQEYAIDDLTVDQRLGSLGLSLIAKMNGMREKADSTPILLNIDNTFKPENWYTYHQLADIPCLDPYYPEQIDSCYGKHPGKFGAHTKPTYVYATTAISQSSGQPKPLHVILCSTQYVPKNPTGYVGRFPTPEEKRMEVYYAVAGGAKGISYWWFSPDSECKGCGADEPDARALWKEIGLLGAEVRTAGPVITMGCPADLKIEAPKRLWVKSLVSGLDTAAVVVVNDDVLCDRLGTVFKPQENSKMKVTLPAWVIAKEVFEVTYEGTKDVSWKSENGKVALDLGTVSLSRFVIITSDAGLRAKLQKLYESKFAANVAELLDSQGK